MKVTVTLGGNKIEDGYHTGKIVSFEERMYNDWTYIDCKIAVDGLKTPEGFPQEIKKGFPAKLNPSSELYLFLVEMGIDVKTAMAKAKDGQMEIDNLTKPLINKKVKFMTLTEPSKKDPTKKFAGIVKNSIKLL